MSAIAEGWAAHSARLAEKLDACRVTYFERLQRWVSASHEERYLKIEFQVVDLVYALDSDDVEHEDRVWSVEAHEVEQFSNREGEGDEGGYAEVKTVVAYQHRDLENACAYVMAQLVNREVAS